MSFFDQLMTLVGAKEATPETPTSSLTSGGGGGKVRTLSAETKAELQKGITYNMKVLLRGMPGVGKTTILSRLCGYPLSESYTPSTGVTTGIIRIRGSNCAPHEGTKVDIWDIVDEGRTDAALRLPPHLHSSKDTALMRQEMINVLNSCVADAQGADMYHNCHMVIFVVDCTRPETLAYASRHAAQVPPSVCILFALNFSDVPPARQKVSLAEVRAACAKVRRTVSPFMQRLLHTNSAPEQVSVGVASLAVSARTGDGINDLLRCLDTPNMLLQIAIRETDLQHRYSELGWLHEKTSAHAVSAQEPRAPASNLDVQPMSTAPRSRAQTGGDAAQPLPHSELKLSNHPNVEPKAREADANDIEKGFFSESDGGEEEEDDDTEEEETEEEEAEAIAPAAAPPPPATTNLAVGWSELAERPAVSLASRTATAAAAVSIDGSVTDTSIHDFLDNVEAPDVEDESESPAREQGPKSASRFTLTPLVSVKSSHRSRSLLPSLLEKAKGNTGLPEQVEVNVDAMVKAMKASLEKPAEEEEVIEEKRTVGHQQKHKAKSKIKNGHVAGETESKLDAGA